MSKFLGLGLIVLFSLFSLTFANAFFIPASNFNIDSKNYAPLERIGGYLNLGMTNEPGNSLLTADINGKKYSLDIYSFLSSVNANFTCNPSECEDTYSVSGSSLREATLSGAIDNYIGFRIAESIAGVTQVVEPGLVFSVLPFETFGTYCGEVPVEIDILDDGIIDWAYINPGNYCGNYVYSSCYSPSADSIIMDSNDLYCQEVSIKPTAKLLLGADLMKMGSNSSGNLSLFVFDPSSQESSDTCYIDTTEISSELFEGHECGINFIVKSTEDYYLCIKSEKSAEYRLRSEQVGGICGYSEIPSEYSSPVADFALYSKIAEIVPFAGIKINSSEFLKQNPSRDLTSSLNDYLSDKYNGDCGLGNECIIPIKINSKKTVNIPGVPAVEETMQIRIRHGVTKTIDYFYKINKNPFLMTSPLHTYSLDTLNISAPPSLGQYFLKMSLGGNYISPVNGTASTGIPFSVASLPKIKSLIPLSVFVSFETPFLVNVSYPNGAMDLDYIWDFGDNTTENSTTPLVYHTYENSGNYTLSVTLIDTKKNIITKDFLVSVRHSQELIEQLISSKKESLSLFSSSLDSFQDFIKVLLNKIYNIPEMSDNLDSLEQSFDTKTALGNASDEDLYLIKEGLDDLKIPLEIKTISELKKTSFIIPVSKIQPRLLENLGAGKSEENIQSSILSWQTSSLDIKIGGEIKSAILDEDSKDDLFTLINIELNPVSPLEEVYLAIILPSGVKFDDVSFAEPYGESDVGDAIGIKFKSLDSSQLITFAMPGNQEMLLNMFASTNFDSLEIISLTNCGNTLCEKGESYRNCPEDCKPIKITLTLIGLIVLGGAVGAFLIWKFYAAVYNIILRKKLFATREEYLNVLIYISHGLNAGKSIDEIRKILEKAGWNKKQLGFALKQASKSYKKVKKT